MKDYNQALKAASSIEVVRLADKIAYLGRDIEDALRLGILNLDALMQLQHLTVITSYSIHYTKLYDLIS